jgi:zona occludens toxin
MPITLVTGTPGGGKTLHAVSELLPKWLGEKLTRDDGTQITRRLCVGGIRDLLIDHEPVEVPSIDWDSYSDKWSGQVRDPGQEPLDVERRADNWWLWVMPGDVLVIDEAQRMFRPMAAGRKLPDFIKKLETHRHYGIDILIITQHPNLIHANVRNLIGRHLHVRRVFSFLTRIIYEWDKCSNPNSLSSAIKRKWKPDKKAYGYYKSAEIHTKSGTATPIVVVLLVVAVLGFPAALWYGFQRTDSSYQAPDAPASAASSPVLLEDSAPVTLVPGDSPRVAPGPTAYADALAPQQSWPLIIGGCWQQGYECNCVTREERPRVVRHLVGLCTAIVSGDLQPPPGLPRPARLDQPVPPGPSAPASAPALPLGIGA